MIICFRYKYVMLKTARKTVLKATIKKDGQWVMTW